MNATFLLRELSCTARRDAFSSLRRVVVACWCCLCNDVPAPSRSPANIISRLAHESRIPPGSDARSAGKTGEAHKRNTFFGPHLLTCRLLEPCALLQIRTSFTIRRGCMHVGTWKALRDAPRTCTQIHHHHNEGIAPRTAQKSTFLKKKGRLHLSSIALNYLTD